MRVEIKIQYDRTEAIRWLTGVARRQIPFATAVALTRTAKAAKKNLQNEMGNKLTLRNGWTLKGVRSRQAKKNSDLSKIYAEVGSADWYMRDQLSEQSNTRKAKKRYRMVPLSGARPNKRAIIKPSLRPKRILSSSRVRVIERSKGPLFVHKTKGLLYAGKTEQKIEPRISLRDQVEATASQQLQIQFRKAMEHATRTAK